MVSYSWKTVQVLQAYFTMKEEVVLGSWKTVQVQNKTYSEESQFTLVNSDGEAAGAGELGLLLYKQGTVCDNNFNYIAADAICVELGFAWATRWNSGIKSFFQDNYDIKMDDVRCESDSWTSCTFRTDHRCDHFEDVFLECHSGEG